MQQFRRTTAWGSMALALSLTGCATMDLATEEIVEQSPPNQVKIDGTWWDSNRVKLEEVAAAREQELSQESQMTTPYSTMLPQRPAEEGAGPGGVVFRNVLRDGEAVVMPDMQARPEPPPVATSNPAPVPTAVVAPPVAAPQVAPPVAYSESPGTEQAFPASYVVRVAHESPTEPEPLRAPPLPSRTSAPSPVPDRVPVSASPPPRSSKASRHGGRAAPPARASAGGPSRVRLQGVARGPHGEPVAMLEVPGSGSQVAREGDTIILSDSTGEPQAFRVQRIANQQVLIQGDHNQMMVIQ